MTTIRREVLIAETPPEEVFDRVTRVEEFATLAACIKEIRALGDERFLWRVELLGAELEWESEIIESIRPTSFAWRSTSGLYNAGRYQLTPMGQNGTKISLTIEYNLKESRTGRLLAPILKPIIELLSVEVLGKIKERLEILAQKPVCRLGYVVLTNPPANKTDMNRTGWAELVKTDVILAGVRRQSRLTPLYYFLLSTQKSAFGNGSKVPW